MTLRFASNSIVLLTLTILLSVPARLKTGPRLHKRTPLQAAQRAPPNLRQTRRSPWTSFERPEKGELRFSTPPTSSTIR